MSKNKVPRHIVCTHLQVRCYLKCNYHFMIVTELSPHLSYVFCNVYDFLLVAAATLELQDDSLPFMSGILRHFALVTVTQQAGMLFAFDSTS